MTKYLIKDRNGSKVWGSLSISNNRISVVFRDNIDLDKEQPPAYIRVFLTKCGTVLNAEQSLMWLTDRLIPKNRQNLSEILRANGLKTYTLCDMLDLTKGRCSFDDVYLERQQGT